MDRNYFSTRDQILFITYEDVVKLNYSLLLQTVIKDYKDELGGILKLEEIEDYDINNLNRLCIERTHRNPLRYICKDENFYPMCDELMDMFEVEFTDMYAKAQLTDFGAKLYNIFMQPFIKKVYIHTDKKIYQIPYDCSLIFSDFNNKIEYVYGEDIIGFIKSLSDKPTSYILNDIEIANELIENDLAGFTEILIAELGYNYKLNDEKNDIVLKYDLESLMHEKTFKMGILPILLMNEKHFSNLKIIDDGKDVKPANNA